MQHRQVGDRVPEVRFRLRENGQWKERDSGEIFTGRKVVVFALPGAFTPTCSSSHLPRYEELAGEMAEAGVDEILCLSVNDGFGMEAWGADQGVDKVSLLADGNGEFTDAMGMLVDKSDLGFSKRSWRYSMVVKDGVIEKLFSEPEVEGDPYGVSDAETMLRYLNPGAVLPADILLLTKPGCSHCGRAKRALAEAGLGYEAIDVGPRAIRAVSDTHATPRVFVDGKLIGGADELADWLSKREG